jgi:hypothetical protein
MVGFSSAILLEASGGLAIVAMAAVFYLFIITLLHLYHSFLRALCATRNAWRRLRINQLNKRKEGWDMTPFRFVHKDNPQVIYHASQHPDQYDICVVSKDHSERGMHFPVSDIPEKLTSGLWILK